MLELDPDEAAVSRALVDTGFDTTSFTATVNSAPAPSPAAVETGFGELDGTPSPIRPAPTINAEADTGTPEDPDDDLDARVAAPLPNKPITDWNAVQAFMAAVVPWPASSNDAGWVNLHYSWPDKKTGKVDDRPFGGACFKELDGFNSFMDSVQWRLTHPESTASMWFCLSLQKHTHEVLNKHGKVKAQRNVKDAVGLKSIWIDIDIKPNNPKCYPDINTALLAFEAFRVKNGLPDPSAIVRSGGGVHIYYINRDTLTPDDWRVYAGGLKQLCLNEGLLVDAGLMTDASRVLRVPGTFNYKTDPPKPVKLLTKTLRIYDFEPTLAFLQKFAIAPRSPQAAKSEFSFLNSTATKPSPLFAAALDPQAESLADGIDKHEDRKVDPAPIFEQCGFYREARDTGGRDQNQTQWNLAILGATFMESGNAIAHEISSGHVTYTADDTTTMYERKVAERSASGTLGYPSCAAIAGAGCEACKTCPHFGTITSPLKLGTMRPQPNQGDGTAQQTPNAGAGSGDERLVVPKDDHMGRARIYRNTKRPNLYHYRDDYYDHEGGHYTIIDDDTIRADLYEFLDHCDKKVPCKGKPTETEVVSFAPNKSSVSETSEALKALGHVVPTVEQPHWLDRRTGPDPADLICFPNGILNINSNQFTPPDPMLFTPHGVGFDYDLNAAAPTQWLNFLDQVFNGELDQIGSLQEMFGYCLSSDVSQEKVFMLLGDKRSGKDTIRHTLQSLLSPTVICGPTLDSMATNFGMSQLICKQLAVVGDMRLGTKCDKDLLAEHVLKLSGRGLFTIDRKHKSHWTGPLPCKLLLISNEMPTLKDASGALASRMITYRTRTTFYGREDPQLFDNKIRPELPAILLWALHGLRRMRQRGPIAEPACSTEAREELAREGSPIMSFVQECLTLDAAATVDKNVMYSAYLDFAHHNGLRAVDKGWFYRNLETATAGKVKAERVQNGGVRVHNVVGARISNPPPKKPTKNEPIVVYAAAPAAATQTAGDVGKPSKDDVALDKTVKNMQTPKTGRPKCRRSAGTQPSQQRPRERSTLGTASESDVALDETVENLKTSKTA